MMQRISFALGFIFLTLFLGLLWHPGRGLSGAAPEVLIQPFYQTINLLALPDFEKIKGTEVRLFYPAQASWQWLNDPLRHPGAQAVSSGLACRTCHIEGGDLDQSHLGLNLVNNPELEPDPIPGKRPTLDLLVKAAFDDEFMYFWFQWESEDPGVWHNVLRFDATQGKWVGFGGPIPFASPGLYEDRLTFLVGQRKGEPGYVTADSDVGSGFQEYGCFITCHNSMRDMPQEVEGEPVTTHPYLGQKGEPDIRKYLLLTRDKSFDPTNPNHTPEGQSEEVGRWSLVKRTEELNALQATGKFLDMWMWRTARSGHIGYADDSWTFEYRNSDQGRSPWSRQRASNLNDPNFAASVYDPAKVSPERLNGGTFAIRGGDDPLAILKRLPQTIPFITLHGETFTLFDGTVAESISIPRAQSGYVPQHNDLLFDRRLRIPKESRGNILAHGVFTREEGASMGTWTLILKRKLDTGNPDDLPLVKGKLYLIAFAIHDDHNTTRFHHVSFPYALGMGEDVLGAMIKARYAGSH